MASALSDIDELLELSAAEGAGEMLDALSAELDGVEKQLAALEFQRMFSGPMDSGNAFLGIQAGAGGTEAQDWVGMLLRMYLRWGERRGFETELLEMTPGEVGGYLSATARFAGPFAFGWLRTDTGVHRLVRKSPFDAGNRRHTSFAAVLVTPEIGEDIEIVVDAAELRVDTYRASGAGGQHVNKTDSAVRITHLPSGIVVQCQSQRSQHQNRERAMQQLRARLYDLEKQNQKSEMDRLTGEKTAIGWGNQIRSYVLDSGRIKDLRTKVESGNCAAMLDGDIDAFLEESLKRGL